MAERNEDPDPLDKLISDIYEDANRLTEDSNDREHDGDNEKAESLLDEAISRFKLVRVLRRSKMK